ncbi:hypothetical protein J4760_00800 [Salinicoccus sp. ID82-1]|uniref:Uncharacterized protein n=1 Tax=Salinicoccus cyprini TaxID=2493691 RepID=A0A558AXS4_9STAP|nr:MULTISPECIES: hypothetical protein [Salinicoccus]MCG1008580.1 hypothetical protein [Salinicoccus sp. ID82-1]TVT29058.1 hypothetical protein FO441_01930 [Salinicoccus cyprini]
MKDRRIFEAVLLERERQDRNMIMIEFNIHPDMVVMNYVYDDHDDGGDVHRKRHDRDPEILDRNTFEAVKEKLIEHNVPYRERRDAFI